MDERIAIIVEDIHKETAQWSKEDQDKFYMAPYNDESLIQFHHSLGRYIRNTYNLWTIPWEPEMKEVHGCMCDCSPYHPDQLSMTIITEVWKKGPYNGYGNIA